MISLLINDNALGSFIWNSHSRRLRVKWWIATREHWNWWLQWICMVVAHCSSSTKKSICMRLECRYVVALPLNRKRLIWMQMRLLVIWWVHTRNYYYLCTYAKHVSLETCLFLAPTKRNQFLFNYFDTETIECCPWACVCLKNKFHYTQTKVPLVELELERIDRANWSQADVEMIGNQLD